MLAEVVALACTHCGLDVPDGYVIAGASEQFCCAGCRAAYAIIHAHGLDRYYTLGEQREAPVRPSGRTYDEFDHPAFQALYVRPLSGGTCTVELYLEGVHCASCVWLVERVPLIVPGVARAELNVGRSLATIQWDPRSVALSGIARQLDALGYQPHPFRGVRRDEMRRKEDRAMLARIGVAGAIAINVMLAAVALYSGWLGGMDAEWERFFRWISLIVVTPAMFWPGRVFFVGAIAALRTRTLNMDVPIALGLAAGYVRGAMNTVSDTGPVYFDGLATLIFALLVGRFLQQRGQRAAGDSAELLFALTPSSARVVGEDGSTSNVPAEALLPGMTMDVRSGETFAADGVVTQGSSSVDNSLLTGESRPQRVEVGARVFAGTLNLSAGLCVRADETGEASRVAKLMRQVGDAAARRAPVVQMANRLAGYFVAGVLVLAALTWVIWHRIDPSRAMDNAIALLIVTCPCALALSTPLAVSVAIGRAAKRGILVKGGDVLEQLARPSQLLLDKTGTITEARATVVTLHGSADIRPLVLGLEEHSSHPIADALRRAWAGVAPLPATDVFYTTGGGLEGTVDGKHLIVGSPAFVAERARAGHRTPAARFAARDPDGRATRVAIAVDGSIVAAADIGDPVRPDAKASIDALRDSGWSLGILSGDARGVVRSVGRELGLPSDACVGAASPETKLAHVVAARRRGPVVMVGDGVNDAAAMAAASVGIGVHGGAEACLQTADVYLTRPGLGPLVALMEGAQRTMFVIKRNIAFSLVYNLAGAGLAMAGVLSPLVAAILMPASSLTVVLASWRSRTFAEDAS
jgi:Cu2+-exporting ATPase